MIWTTLTAYIITWEKFTSPDYKQMELIVCLNSVLLINHNHKSVTYTFIYQHASKVSHLHSFRQQNHIIKCGMCLISRVGLISEWTPYWIHYDLHTCISHKQPHFAYIKTFQVFLRVGNSIGIITTCSSIAVDWNCSMS